MPTQVLKRTKVDIKEITDFHQMMNQFHGGRLTQNTRNFWFELAVEPTRHKVVIVRVSDKDGLTISTAGAQIVRDGEHCDAIGNVQPHYRTASVVISTRPEYKNLGYGTTALRALLGELPPNVTFQASVAEDNVASSRILTKVGAVITKTEQARRRRGPYNLLTFTLERN